MLFDLRGKRRRVVQVVYGLLAASFLIGFVFFGVGTGGGIGSISDLFSGGGGSSTSSQFDDQIDAANEQLTKDPKDTAALLKLAENEWFKAKSGVEQDPNTGQVTGISDEAHTDLGQSADAWTKYLKLNQGKPDSGVASEMVQVYYLLGDASGAAKAQGIVTSKTPNTGTYNQLAYFEYASLDIAAGDAAAKKSVSLAPSIQRKQLKNQLDQIREPGGEGQEAGGEGAEEGAEEPAIGDHPGHRPAAEPIRRRRSDAVAPGAGRPLATIRPPRAVSSTGRAGDS